MKKKAKDRVERTTEPEATDVAPTPAADPSRELLAALGQMTGGLSPQAFGGAWLSVVSRLALSPSRQLELAGQAVRQSLQFARFAGEAVTGRSPAPQAEGTPYKQRFADPAWARFPFNVLAEAFLRGTDLAREAVREVPGADPGAAELVGFTVREGLELVAPDNFLPTNPQLLALTREQRGQNLVRGLRHFVDDLGRVVKGAGPAGTEEYRVGVELAASPGKVVLRTPLMELIQYAPTTKTVHAEPVLVVPAWIMKYYILDLSPKNSFVKYLTDQGHTVFMISWKNPTAADRDVSMDDYLELGIAAALDAIAKVRPGKPVHGVGYCIGGTLLAIAAAWLAARGEQERLATVSLLAAQTDFSEPGELSLFINPQQLAMLDALMWKKGVLESRQMGGAFQLLRTYDLLWAPAAQSYLKGERPGMNDLMAWNADGTRMAWRMHTDYLHQLYLHNDLAEGRYRALGETLDLAAIEWPMFVVGTETDHVAPWPSVYKIGKLARSKDYTFCLTSGGHNAGIVSGAVHPRRRHRALHVKSGARLPSTEKYLQQVEPQQGSWWPTFAAWLAAHSSADKVKPPTMGAPRKGLAPVCDAPGEYVLAQ